MEIFSMVLALLSGVAMFLYGMLLMGDPSVHGDHLGHRGGCGYCAADVWQAIRLSEYRQYHAGIRHPDDGDADHERGGGASAGK